MILERGNTMVEVSFYRCKDNGAVVFTTNSTITPSCCGEPMELLVAGSTDGASEKHVPFVERNGSHLVARVGEVNHPMLDEHYIEWIAVASSKGLQISHLNPGEEPVAEFEVPEGEAVVVYEYCNLHGLWKVEA